MESLGPPVTVGEPGERIPRLGGSREYITGQWKSVVADLLGNAAVRIFILADTENVLWEFRRAVESHRTSDLLVIVPPLRRRRTLESRWLRFMEASADLLGSSLPMQMPGKTIIGFCFCQDEPVLILSKKRKVWDYLLAVRLFLCLHRQNPATMPELASYLQVHLPSLIGG